MGDSRANGICRDYQRGVCNRGQNCKFHHPEGAEPTNHKLPICKDYQNKGCDRIKCKFLHITSEEEAEYMRTGVLPEHGGHPQSAPASSIGKDVCKDFLNNICNRGSKCKFQHIPVDDFPPERPTYSAAYGKRRRDDYSVHDSMSPLADENEMLRRKITDLQRQVLDLRQMNDTLYDQNTRYRNQLRGQPSADPYAAKPVSYPPAATSSAVSRSIYDGYTQF